MTRPLTGYEKEIAILHAEANQSAELIEEFKGIANGYKQAIERVRKLHEPWLLLKKQPVCKVCVEIENQNVYWVEYPCPTIKALDGDD